MSTLPPDPPTDERDRDPNRICREHGKRIGALEETVGGIRERLGTVDGKLDQVLERLHPMEADKTIGGKVVGAVERVSLELLDFLEKLATSRTGIVLALAVLVGAVAGTGLVFTGSLSDGFSLGPASSANQEAVEGATLNHDTEDETASGVDDTDPIESIVDTIPAP